MRHLSELKKGQRPNMITHPHMRDATEPLVFEVEYICDVKGSVVGSIEQCAGAHGLRRLSGVIDARVMKSTTYVEFEDGRILKYRNPAPLNQAVDGFDHTAGLFPPGRYRLEPTKAHDRIGARKTRLRGTESRPVPRRQKIVALR